MRAYSSNSSNRSMFDNQYLWFQLMYVYLKMFAAYAHSTFIYVNMYERMSLPLLRATHEWMSWLCPNHLLVRYTHVSFNDSATQVFANMCTQWPFYLIPILKNWASKTFWNAKTLWRKLNLGIIQNFYLTHIYHMLYMTITSILRYWLHKKG